MKKIGILHGKERSFPQAFVERINSKNIPGIVAEPVRIDKVVQGVNNGYAVIIDRISQDVPHYRAYLKNAALTGTAVINNPFTLLLRESLDLSNLPVIGVDVVKLHLKRRMLLDEQDRFDVPILKRFVIPNVKHCHQNQNQRQSCR